MQVDVFFGMPTDLFLACQVMFFDQTYGRTCTLQSLDLWTWTVVQGLRLHVDPSSHPIVSSRTLFNYFLLIHSHD